MNHLHLVGTLERDRLGALSELVGHPVVARCNKRLRGPYTGVDTFLASLLPAALTSFPSIVDRHRLTLLYGMPELAQLIGVGPREMAADAPFTERTRFYGASMVRCMSQDIVTFVREYAQALAETGGRLPPVMFDGAHLADPTTQEFVALLVRRVDPRLLVVAVGSDGGCGGELGEALAAHAERIEAPAAAASDATGTAVSLAARYVQSDGTADDPALLAAYGQLTDGERAELHDRRADELAPAARWGLRIGALTYHREHGSDPAGAGVEALLPAIEYCTSVGFSAMVVELGQRARALLDPELRADDYRRVTNQVASAMIPAGRLEESMDLLHELRRHSALPLTHMTTSYSLAMMYTRFLTPRDHNRAIEWQHNAMAIASLLPDEHDRLVFMGFQDNAMALIEMHRGNLRTALELVEGALARADDRLRPDEWTLHRSQLLYNRTRLLAGLGEHEQAYLGFSTLIEMDPHYTDYLSERAKISRKSGDLRAALADYDLAVRLGPPFPELIYNRGAVHLELGDIEAALADFDYVLDMEPGDADTRLIRAELFLDAEELPSALEDVQAGLDIRPQDPRLLCLRGSVLLAQGQLAAARADFDSALFYDQRYPAALVNRAVVLFESGEARASAADLTSAIDQLGPDPDLLLNRGIARAACADPTAALADFELALTMPDADVAELHFQRGLCLLDQGRKAAAEESLRTSLEHQHRVPEVTELLFPTAAHAG